MGLLTGSGHRVKETYAWGLFCFYGTEFEPVVSIH